MSDTHGPDPTDATPGNAAERIIERFGGIRPMASKLEVPVTTVQGWKKRGAIPSNRHPDLIAAAARHNIHLDPAELEAAAPADERVGEDRAPDEPTPEQIEAEGVAIPPAFDKNMPGERDDERRHASVVDAPPMGGDMPSTSSSDVTLGDAAAVGAVPRREGHAHHPAPPRSGGGGMAATAMFVSLLALAGAATSPWWAPSLLTPVLGPPGGQQAGDAPSELERRVAELDQRVQQIANRPATPTPPAVAGTPAVDGGAFERRIAEIEQRLQRAPAAPATSSEAPQPPAAAGASPELERRIAELEQQIRQASAASAAPVVDEQAQNQVRQLSQRLEEVSRSVQQVQGTGSQVSTLQQELDQLRQRTAQLDQQLAQRRDDESRAQALALAAAQVRAAVQGSQPYQPAVETLRAFNPEDPQLRQSLDTLSSFAATGVPTRALLAERFGRISGDIARAGSVGEDGSWTDQALSRVNSLVSFRRPAGEGQGSGPSAIVSRAEARLGEGDLQGAVNELSQLQGGAQEVARPWLQEARARLAVDEAATTLTNIAVSRLAGTSGGGTAQANDQQPSGQSQGVSQ